MEFSHIFNYKNLRFTCLVAVFLTFSSIYSFAETALELEASHQSVGHAEEKFDPTVTILEHISDTHSWHIIGNTAIPLPVILFTQNGLDIFLSNKLVNQHHQAKAYNSGKNIYFNEKEHIKILASNGKVDEEATAKLYDFSLTKNVCAMFIAVIAIILVFTNVAGKYKKRAGLAPKGLQSFAEPLIIFIRDDIARPNIGYKYEKFMPLLLTIFFFIWFNNLLGLIPIFPGSANVTGNIAVTMVLAAIVLVVVNLNGNKYYWAHIFKPDVPFWLLPIMWIVEIIGIFSKPFALMIRLFANITAGHIIVLSLVSLIFIFKSLAIAPVSVAFVLFMSVLELLVAFLQAFIFTMLTALFIGTAVEEHHH